MTFNLISDIHCAYDYDAKKVCWNRQPYQFDCPESDLKDKDTAIKACDELLSKIHSSEKDILDLGKIKLPDYMKYKINSLNELIHLIEKLKHHIIHNVSVPDVLDKVTAIIRYLDDIQYKSDYKLTFDKFSVHYKIARPLYRMFSDFVPEKLQPADYLLVAGDLSYDPDYKLIYNNLKERTKHLFKDVFFVKGNHDYWWFSHKNNSKRPKNPNIKDRYLERDFGDVVLLGCTMWTPVLDELQHYALQMNDYNYTPGLTISKVNKMYMEESTWLRGKVNYYKSQNKKVIVMTHHLPIKELVNTRYSVNQSVSYVVVDGSCDNIKPDVWVHGHSHNYIDITKDGTRYIRNPIGYREFYDMLPSEVNPDHWYNTIIEI